MPTSDPLHYDVFISYARGEFEWVEKNVYEPLTRCRRVDGERPEIFLDRRDGIQIGENWRRTIDRALQVSDKVIGVHSRLYWTRDQCESEWLMATSLDERRRKTGHPIILCPILKDPLEPDNYLPLYCELTNYIDIRAEGVDWFDELRRSLKLVASSEVLSLDFESHPQDVQVNQTLNEIRVRLKSEPARALKDETVRLVASNDTLGGEVAKMTQSGVAIFRDLSMTAPGEEVRLVAEVDGYKSEQSAAFSVEPTRAIRTPALEEVGQEIGIEAHGEVHFFSAADSIVVIRPEEVLLFDGQAKRLASVPLHGPVKCVLPSGQTIAVLEWTGRLVLLHADGRSAAWDPPESGGHFDSLPGGACFSGESVQVGFWSGRVVAYRFGAAPLVLMSINRGVQSIGVSGELTVVATSDGRLEVFRAGQLTNSYELEPGALGLKIYDQRVIAASDRNLFYVDLDSPTARPLQQAHPIDGLAAVLWESENPVLVGRHGEGVRIDHGLNYRTRFHVAAGAIPVSADEGGMYCVFRNPDGTRTLMEDARMIYTHPDGVLAVSPDAERFAVGDGSTITLLKAGDFNQLRRSA